jgi:hypothetical protein
VIFSSRVAAHGRTRDAGRGDLGVVVARAVGPGAVAAGCVEAKACGVCTRTKPRADRCRRARSGSRERVHDRQNRHAAGASLERGKQAIEDGRGRNGRAAS